MTLKLGGIGGLLLLLAGCVWVSREEFLIAEEALALRLIPALQCEQDFPDSCTRVGFSGDGEFEVPSGVYQLKVQLWGGGGGGGAGVLGRDPESGLLYGMGGGGGAGSYGLSLLEVVPGERLSFQVGRGGEGASKRTVFEQPFRALGGSGCRAGGDGGMAFHQGGGGGGATCLKRGEQVLVLAGGGGGGGTGAALWGSSALLDNQSRYLRGGRGGFGGGALGGDAGEEVKDAFLDHCQLFGDADYAGLGGQSGGQGGLAGDSGPFVRTELVGTALQVVGATDQQGGAGGDGADVRRIDDFLSEHEASVPIGLNGGGGGGGGGLVGGGGGGGGGLCAEFVMDPVGAIGSGGGGGGGSSFVDWLSLRVSTSGFADGAGAELCELSHCGRGGPAVEWVDEAIHSVAGADGDPGYIVFGY